ncbi:hypothetical protein FRB99_004616 [Tulasnella sp. 403]|nr:hypothetical protein FRB99_004616 [Tulasnella sp. 403]
MALVTISGYPASGKSRRVDQLTADLETRLADPQYDGPKLKVVVISDDLLGITRNVYDDSRTEKPARAAAFTNLTRHLGKDTIVIMDGMNYIKGYRYQMYCAAREAEVRMCTIFVAATSQECRDWNAAKDPDKQYAPSTLENLIMRFEEPNSMARWDSPLFTVSSDDTLPVDAIWQTLMTGAKASLNVAVLQNAKPPTDALQVLESTSATIVGLISSAAVMNSGSGGRTPLPLSATTRVEITLPARNISLAELQRHKRQFVSIHKKALTQGAKGSLDWTEETIAQNQVGDDGNRVHEPFSVGQGYAEDLSTLEASYLVAVQISTPPSPPPTTAGLEGAIPTATMQLTISPVTVYPSKAPQPQDQAHGKKLAIAVRLSQESVRSLKDALVHARTAVNGSAGRPPLQVNLSGDAPGFTISNQFFPISVEPSRNSLVEVFVRTRHPNPTRPIHHRPPFLFTAPVVATVRPQRTSEEDVAQVTQKIRERTAQVEQQRKDRHIQMIDPPATTKGSKSSNPSKQKRTSAGAGTASKLARNVLQKGVAVKAKNEGSGGTAKPLASSSTASSSNPPPPRQVPLSSIPAVPVGDTTSLRARVVHQLALKSSTSRELQALLKPSEADTEGLSEVLRSVATTEVSPPAKPSQSHWSPAYTSPSQHTGLWYLKAEVYATSVHPFTWPSYDDADRRRIAEDVEVAFKDLGLPDTAPERTRFKTEEKAFVKRRRVEPNGTAPGDSAKRSSVSSASGRPSPMPAPGTTNRKPKMEKLSEPPSTGGGTLSANVRRGIIKSSTPSQAPPASKQAKSTSTSSKTGTTATTGDREKGSEKGSDVETRPSKRLSPSNPATTSSRATPMSASSSSSSGTSLPLAHGLPPKPQTSLAPPPDRRASRTPPPPTHPIPTRPSSTQPGRTPTPNASPRTTAPSKPSAKRKLEDPPSDIDDLILTGAMRGKGGKEPTPATSTELKKRRLDVSGQSTTKREDAGSGKPRPPKERDPPAKVETPRERLHRKERSDWDYTDSSDDEEEEAPPQPKTVKEKKGTKVNVPPPSPRSKPTGAAKTEAPSRDPPPRPKLKYRGLPNPLPSTRSDLRLLFSELYADYATLLAELHGERSRVERVAAGRARSTEPTPWTLEETRAKADMYERLKTDLERVKKAVEESCQVEGEEP